MSRSANYVLASDGHYPQFPMKCLDAWSRVEIEIKSKVLTQFKPLQLTEVPSSGGLYEMQPGYRWSSGTGVFALRQLRSKHQPL